MLDIDDYPIDNSNFTSINNLEETTGNLNSIPIIKSTEVEPIRHKNTNQFSDLASIIPEEQNKSSAIYSENINELFSYSSPAPGFHQAGGG